MVSLLVRLCHKKYVNCYLWTVSAGDMGYELNRFQGDVDEELLCPICSGVLEEPLQVYTRGTPSGIY